MTLLDSGHGSEGQHLGSVGTASVSPFFKNCTEEFEDDHDGGGLG